MPDRWGLWNDRRLRKRKPKMVKRRYAKGRKMMINTNPSYNGYQQLNSIKPAKYRLRYASETLTLTPALGGVAVYSFRANSLFDPESTGVGHQPMPFDTIATLYKHYVVTGAKITATFYPEDAATTYGVVGGIKLDDNGVVSGSIQTLIEAAKNTKWKHFRANANGAGPAMMRVTHTFSCKKFFGLKDVVDNETVGATVATNPTDVAYFNIFYGHADGLTTPPACRVDVLIEFNAIFAEPGDQNSS